MYADIRPSLNVAKKWGKTTLQCTHVIVYYDKLNMRINYAFVGISLGFYKSVETTLEILHENTSYVVMDVFDLKDDE